MGAPAVRALAQSPSGGRVVVIGGGIGGSTVAGYLRKYAPSLDVTVVEPLERITTCFGSNLFLGGARTYESLTHDFTGLERLGAKFVRDSAWSIDTTAKTVKLLSGASLAYDKLVMSPGIAMVYKSVEGYSAEAAEVMPHAWKGGRQLLMLKRQLEDMDDGGVVVIAPPSGAYRCPPAPYERACMIGLYLKAHKPKSKVIVVEPKTTFAKDELFKQAFEQIYPGVIELIQSTEVSPVGVARVDPRTREVTLKSGDVIKAAVVNVIPEQKAGMIAEQSGLTDGDWCPVDPMTFGSRKAKDVYVIGDATQASPMPKSGFAANNQAKLVANDIEAALAGGKKYPPRLRNTCWSAVNRANAIKIGASYRVKDGKLEAYNMFSSELDDNQVTRAMNTSEYLSWYDNITTDIFSKGS